MPTGNFKNLRYSISKILLAKRQAGANTYPGRPRQSWPRAQSGGGRWQNNSHIPAIRREGRLQGRPPRQL